MNTTPNFKPAQNQSDDRNKSFINYTSISFLYFFIIPYILLLYFVSLNM